MKTMKIPLNEITIPEGRRSIDWVKVSELAESIKIVGLINPITVDTDNTLISGGHRYEACKLLGHDEIACVVMDSDELRIELAEIDENLIRNDLEPALRIKAIKRREQIVESLGLRKKPHGDGSNQHKSKVSEMDTLHTNESIASSMGMSESTYRKEKQIGKSIDDDVLDTLAGTGTTKTELEKVAKMQPEEQRNFAEQRSTGEIKDFSDYKLTEYRR